MSALATYELDGHVATITYNRPDALNAINGAMRRDLNEAFARFRDDEAAWVAIVTGAGRAFCVEQTYATALVRPASSRVVLGEAHPELVRERMGDLQAGDRGRQRVLPRLRTDPGDLVRLRDRQRASRVRLP